MPVGTVGRASAVCRSLSELSGPIQTVQTASDRAERSACRTRCRSCLSAVLRTVQTGLSDLSDLSENCLRLLSDCLAGAQAPSLQTRPLPPPSVPLPGRAKPSRAATRQPTRCGARGELFVRVRRGGFLQPTQRNGKRRLPLHSEENRWGRDTETNYQFPLRVSLLCSPPLLPIELPAHQASADPPTAVTCVRLGPV